jgi:cytochrome c biogenesis protein
LPMRTGRGRVLGRRAWRLLCSIKLTVLLVSTVLILSLLGTLFPQLTPEIQADPVARSQWEQAVEARYGSFGNLFGLVGLFNVYSSRIFILFLAALFANGLACTVDRLSPILRAIMARPKVVRTDGFYSAGASRASLKIASRHNAMETIRKLLSKRRYRLLIDERKGATYLRGDKNRFARFGTLVTHGALVLVAFAIVWSARASWREPAVILGPGESYDVPHGQDFQVRHEGFELDTYADGTPRDYRSQLVVVHGGSEVTRKTIRVNDPLTYRGVGFYLWGAGPALRIVGLDAEGMPIPMAPSWSDDIVVGEVSLPITGEVDEATLYLPAVDVTVTVSPSHAAVVDDSAEAPLVFLEASRAGQPLFSDYVTRGEVLQLPGFSLEILPDYYTMLQVVSDPGFAPVILASLLGLIGLLISFYFYPSRIWIKLTDEDLMVVGSAERNQTAFRTEFSQLVKKLGEQVG